MTGQVTERYGKMGDMNEKSRLMYDIEDGPVDGHGLREVREQVYAVCVQCGGPQLVEIRYPEGSRPERGMWEMQEITCYRCQLDNSG